MSKDDNRLRPGVYHGDRAVSKIPTPWRHEYLVAIPNEKKLDPKMRKRMTEVGPNGELGYLIEALPYRDGKAVQAGFKESKLKAVVNPKRDWEHGDLRRLKSNNINRSIAKSIDYADKFKPTKYPNPIINGLGLGRNSNTFARSVIEQAGLKGAEEENAIRHAGIRYRFEELRPAMIELKKKEEAPVVPSYNPHKLDIYTEKEKKNLTKDEQSYGAIRRTGPYIAGAMAGTAIGGVFGKPGKMWKAGLTGAVVGALAQRGLRAVAEKQGEQRKPLQGAIAYGLLPAIAAASPYVKGKKIPGLSRLSLKKKPKAKPALALAPKGYKTAPSLRATEMRSKGATTDFSLLRRGRAILKLSNRKVKAKTAELTGRAKTYVDDNVTKVSQRIEKEKQAVINKVERKVEQAVAKEIETPNQVVEEAIGRRIKSEISKNKGKIALAGAGLIGIPFAGGLAGGFAGSKLGQDRDKKPKKAKRTEFSAKPPKLSPRAKAALKWTGETATLIGAIGVADVAAHDYIKRRDEKRKMKAKKKPEYEFGKVMPLIELGINTKIAPSLIGI